MPISILTVVGARPQFIKASVLSREFHRWNLSAPKHLSINEILVHTGQHYDDSMSESFFRDLSLHCPNYNLEVGSAPHGVQTGQMLSRIEGILLKESPEFVLVFGDTNSTLAGSIAAAKLHIPVIHVEAGLRSFNKKMPEEVNRVLTDHCSEYLFCPTLTAINNLKNEGITKNVFLSGDVMCDSLFFYEKKINSEILNDLNLKPKNYLLATIHRAENVGNFNSMKNIVEIINRSSSIKRPTILLLHPGTKKALERYDLKLISSVIAINPQPYFKTLSLLKNAFAVLTDSGGLQKEAFLLKTPCITLREQTEWVETVECGANYLFHHSPYDINTLISRLENKVWRPDFSQDLYGDGEAGRKIVGNLMSAIEKNINEFDK